MEHIDQYMLEEHKSRFIDELLDLLLVFLPLVQMPIQKTYTCALYMTIW